VVVSAGNNGNDGIRYPPANDPFVITAGAVDTKGTPSIVDDILALFSDHGTTQDGFMKPDFIVPGANIIAALASDDSNLALDHPTHTVAGPNGNHYFRMSGTSMASAVAAGAVALLLQDEPTLTPDQVKYRLNATAIALFTYKYLNIYAAVRGNSTQSANTGVAASQLLWTGTEPITWGSAGWNSVSWNTVSWNTVSWNTVSWNTVSWNTVHWDD
jgi:serine protease AprX